MKSAKINIWLIVDGKRGHEKQSEHLVKELQKHIDIEIVRIKAMFLEPILTKLFTILIPSSISHWFKQDFQRGKPDLIIGAGHATHLHMIFAKILNGGKTVIIMKPSFPCSWFDLSLIPRHDGVPEKKGIFLTNGTINNIENEKKHVNNRGLIVLGGHSKHFKWDNKFIINQIYKIIDQHPKIKFKIATSRRTPKDFIDDLSDDFKKNTPVFKYEKVNKSWFSEEVKFSKHAWVTKDSISMIYELIVAGSEVNLINLEKQSDSKISIEISRLINTGYIRSYGDKRKKINNTPLNNEAKRCASFIFKKWLKR